MAATVGFESIDREFGGFERAQGARRRWTSYAAAIAVHVLIVAILALTITVRLPDPLERKPEPQLVVVAPRIVPPPPDVEKLGPVDVVTTQPRFRPRMPTRVRERRQGDPALAIWKYLCNRDDSLSEATQRSCPEFQFGDAGLGLFDPLNRSGDVGAMFGADTTTMTLEEASAARGWTKRPAAKGQSGLAGKTDTVNQPRGPDLFDALPTLKPPTEAAPDWK